MAIVDLLTSTRLEVLPQKTFSVFMAAHSGLRSLTFMHSKEILSSSGLFKTLSAFSVVG